eukprot:TRINITY_DN1343_c0_g1_i2.p1 TRINITY_DN1343_c0_g1~~TRINITY_DN1343_c0_g1_i2.p1  ORF type:complete len:144 (-),score=26.64 TRINITY_DN1343_c0_g1_i2:72-503(-)
MIGFCQVLGQLSVVGDITKEEFQRRFRELQSVKDTYYIIVVENLTTKEIVGSGSLIIERKFLHHCGNVGHIEDIVVDSKYRGHNLGFIIMKQLNVLAHRKGVYKLLLDCSEKNVPFYEKCGYKTKELQMVQYFPENEKDRSRL